MGMAPIFVLLSSAAIAAVPASFNARERAAAEHISGRALAAHVRMLSDDLLEGRAPGTRGSELGMRYVASHFEQLGLKPGDPSGAWFQRFDLVGMRGEVKTPLTFSAGGKTLVLQGAETVISAGKQEESLALRDAEAV